jgi:hypothetical protein
VLPICSYPVSVDGETVSVRFGEPEA